MREASYNSRDERSSSRKQNDPVPPLTKPEHIPHHHSKASPPSRVVSWSDPNELTQLLDFFTTPPQRNVELPSQLTHHSSSFASSVYGRLERSPYTAASQQ